MRMAIVYDPQSSKLMEQTYSLVYRDMWRALIDRFEDVVHITEETDFSSVDADVIIIYDLHASHHLKLKGLREHGATKYTFYNDPWQKTAKGTYWYKQNTEFFKLGAKERVQRTLDRGIDYIICQSQTGFWKHIAPYLGTEAEKMFVWFPLSPDIGRFDFNIPLADREPEILLNGHRFRGWNGWRPYEFRRWAFEQDIALNVEHVLLDKETPAGKEYPRFLSKYAGACSFASVIVPKYSEISAAGCVNFVQMHYDCKAMGFVDGENCIAVTRGNFRDRARDFKENINEYQDMADAGRKLIEENWTSKCFADFIYNHAKRKMDVAA